MANVSVQGRVIDENGAGLGDLEVVVYDLEILGLEDRLGAITTTLSGNFTVIYSPWTYGPFEGKPDLKVRIFDPVGRLLFESIEYRDVTETSLIIGDVTIPSDVLRGFRVTLRQGYPTAAPPAPTLDPYPLLSQDNHVEILLDNEAAWARVTQAVEQATTSIHVIQLWFNVGRFISVFQPPVPQLGSPTTGTRLEEVLLQVSRSQDVQVRLLLNDVQWDAGLLDSVAGARRYFEETHQTAPHSVLVQSFLRPYNTPLHAKMVVVDSRIAFVIGSPFIQGYFDAPTHFVNDPRRGIKSFFEHTDASPLHDVSAAIQGPAVGHLNDTFRLLWNSVASAAPPATPPPPATTNASVQIVRTLPGNLLPSVPHGETGILEAYLRAIREAQDFIFLDNQYFTEPMIADALVKALNARPSLQVIMVVNGRVDIPFYNTMQPNLIRDMLDSVSQSARARLGLFTLWSHDASVTPQRIIRIYTHAKVGAVDDRWATVGSANLDGVSLRLSQHVIPPVTENDRLEERAIEVNALYFSDVDGLPVSPLPGDLRRIVWAEHLGYPSPNHPDLLTPPTGGWLELWKSRAVGKLAGLAALPPQGHPARILEWRPEVEPARHLLALGLSKANLAQLTVETSGRSFDFKTGTWK